jgi:tetratricopeptide (TPR) repeat protein
LLKGNVIQKSESQCLRIKLNIALGKFTNRYFAKLLFGEASYLPRCYVYNMKDWYRNKSWSKEIENDFFSKLHNARKDNRAQYLKIQAIELIETKKLNLLKVAESFLKTILEEYSEYKIEQSPTFNALGDIYKIRKEYDKAIEYYKKALDFEQIYPNLLTQAYLNY